MGYTGNEHGNYDLGFGVLLGLQKYQPPRGCGMQLVQQGRLHTCSQQERSYSEIPM